MGISTTASTELNGLPGRLAADLLEDLFRTEFFHRKRERKNLGNRLDGERVTYVAQGVRFVVVVTAAIPNSLESTLARAGDVIGVLAACIVLEHRIRFVHRGFEFFFSRRNGAAALGQDGIETTAATTSSRWTRCAPGVLLAVAGVRTRRGIRVEGPERCSTKIPAIRRRCAARSCPGCTGPLR